MMPKHGPKDFVKDTVRTLLCGSLKGALALKRSFTKTRQALTSGGDGQEKVFDVVNCGPRHRFCTPFNVLHNCLGAGYGVGPNKFKDVARIMAGLELTDEDAAKTIADYRASNPKIVSFWQAMGRSIQGAVVREEELFTIKLPSGRTMYYWNPRKRKIKQIVKDEDGNDKVIEKENIYCQQERNNKSSYRKTYGPLLVENLTQAIARDILRDAWIALAKAGYHVITTVHDEFIIDLEPGQTQEEAERIILSAGENSWASFIPLGVEGQTSMHFTK